MQQLIYFFQKFKYFLFFLLLQFIALTLIFNNLNFQNSKYVNSANALTGGLYRKVSDMSDYFSLKLAIDDTSLLNLRCPTLLLTTDFNFKSYI